MDINGRFDHIEDVLVQLHSGQWFGFGNSEKIYSNLVIHSDDDKPTEKELTDALAKNQSDFDAQDYARNRTSASGYPSITAQLDEIYHNGIDSWKAVIKVTKDKYPKG